MLNPESTRNPKVDSSLEWKLFSDDVCLWIQHDAKRTKNSAWRTPLLSSVFKVRRASDKKFHFVPFSQESEIREVQKRDAVGQNTKHELDSRLGSPSRDYNRHALDVNRLCKYRFKSNKEYGLQQRLQLILDSSAGLHLWRFDCHFMLMVIHRENMNINVSIS